MNMHTLAFRVTCCTASLAVFAALALPSFATDTAAAVDSRVSVSWSDPAKFAEVRDSHGRGLTRSDVWLDGLKKHLERRAARALPDGQQLEVRFTDIKLAGAFEPWHGPQFDDVRIIKDIYPPRIDLHFALKSADGSVIAEGERTLRDLGFLSRGSGNTSDVLRYEKRMLDDWINREFVREKPLSAS